LEVHFCFAPVFGAGGDQGLLRSHKCPRSISVGRPEFAIFTLTNNPGKRKAKTAPAPGTLAGIAMKTSIIIFLTIFTLSFGQTFGQVTSQTRTITLKPLISKKTLRIRDGNYLLYFNASAFLQTVKADSTVNKLNNYFLTKDTLFVTLQKEKDMNISIFQELNTFKKYAMIHGEVGVFNFVTKSNESELLCVATNETNKNEKVKDDKVSTYGIYTLDKKYLFFNTSGDALDNRTK
jgi:hypothetical protein